MSLSRAQDRMRRMTPITEPKKGERFEFDFNKLSKAQQETLGNIAVGFNSGMYNRRTIARLIEFGLIEQVEDLILPGRFPVHVKQYAMPIYAHIAWCEWCSKNVTEDEAI